MPHLRIPPVALTTGDEQVVWCDRNWGPLRLGGPRIKLPYDPMSAAKLRRGARFAHVHRVVLLAYVILAVAVIADWMPGGSTWLPIATVVLLLAGFLANRWDVAPRPARTGAGDLYLAGVPEPVALRWTETNSFVRRVERAPVRRHFSRRAHLVTAAACGISAIVCAVIASPLGAGILVVAALVALYRSFPAGYIRFESDTK
ncbi:hypothetical protein ACQPZX_29100 [Actinoplanes sp. CA-142083]|uniref:hypothetical protein n=1 Tax=Actinoplanes sp. CA-142083 TaxID=3239903 RepID=UPI003D8CD125